VKHAEQKKAAPAKVNPFSADAPPKVKGADAKTHPEINIPGAVVQQGNQAGDSKCAKTDPFGNCIVEDDGESGVPAVANNKRCARGNKLCCVACKIVVANLFNYHSDNAGDKLCGLVPADQKAICSSFLLRSRTDRGDCSNNGECLVKLLASRIQPLETCTELGLCVAEAADQVEELSVVADMLIQGPVDADMEIDNPDDLEQLFPGDVLISESEEDAVPDTSDLLDDSEFDLSHYEL